MRLLRILMALGLLAGCRPEPPQTIEPATFIEVMVQLRAAERATTDTLAFDEAKRDILARASVTDSQLVEFVAVYGADPLVMAEIWDSIDARVNARPAEGADTARSP